MSLCQLNTYNMMITYHTENKCAIVWMDVVMVGGDGVVMYWISPPPKGGSQIQYKWCGALSTPRQPPNQSPLLRPKVKEGQQLVMMIGWLMLMWWWVWWVSHKMAAYIKKGHKCEMAADIQRTIVLTMRWWQHTQQMYPGCGGGVVWPEAIFFGVTCPF